MLLFKLVLMLLKNLLEFIDEVSLFMAHLVFHFMKFTFDPASLHNLLLGERNKAPVGTLDFLLYCA